jgi:hypothetical protein
MKPGMNDIRSTNGDGRVAPPGLKTPGHWAALTGRWSFDSGVSVYEGPLEVQQEPYGLTLSDLQLRDGRA